MFDITFPTVVGRDFAGVVVCVPSGSNTSFKVGDRVVGIVPVGGGKGSFSQYVAAQVDLLVLLPDNVSFVDAAALPTAGCTTYQALASAGHLSNGSGKKILILGGSSSTGHFAIQLAKAAGFSRIVTTSSQASMCLAAGATEVIDHRASGGTGAPWEEQLAGQGFDVIYDTVEGLPAWEKAQKVLKPRGAFVSIVMDDPHADARIGGIAVFMSRVAYRWMRSWLGYPTYAWHVNVGSVEGLRELVGMAAGGAIKPVLDGGRAEAATVESVHTLWNKQRSGHAHGRLVMAWK